MLLDLARGDSPVMLLLPLPRLPKDLRVDRHSGHNRDHWQSLEAAQAAAAAAAAAVAVVVTTSQLKARFPRRPETAAGKSARGKFPRRLEPVAGKSAT